MNRSSARRPRSGLHCREAVARPSRSPIGDCYDCAMCESFVRDLKRPGFARCGHLRGRVSQGPMEGRKRKTRVALPSRNVGNDQPSTESGQLHLSSRRQRCDDPLNPPSTRRSRSGCDVAKRGCNSVRCWPSRVARISAFRRGYRTIRWSSEALSEPAIPTTSGPKNGFRFPCASATGISLRYVSVVTR